MKTEDMLERARRAVEDKRYSAGSAAPTGVQEKRYEAEVYGGDGLLAQVIAADDLQLLEVLESDNLQDLAQAIQEIANRRQAWVEMLDRETGARWEASPGRLAIVEQGRA